MLSAEPHKGNQEASGEASYGRSLYNRFRYYDPEVGRYVSADPIGQLGLLARAGVAMSRHPNIPYRVSTLKTDVVSFDPNVFNYALGSPTNFADPNGEIIPIAIGFGVGGLTAANAAANVGLTGGRFWAAVAAGAVIGGVSGGAAIPFLGSGFAGLVSGGAIIGATAGGTGNIVVQALVPCGSISLSAAGQSALQGAAVGAFGAALVVTGGGAFPAVANAAPAFGAAGAGAVSLHLSTNAGPPSPLPVP